MTFSKPTGGVPALRHTTQPCSDRCICHMLASSSAVNLFLLHTTHERDPMQTELASAKAQLQEADAERAALRSQADELSGELDWCVRDLFRLKQLEISSRCLDWLDGAEGLSTVRAHTQHAASAAEPTASAARGHTCARGSSVMCCACDDCGSSQPLAMCKMYAAQGFRQDTSMQCA